MNFATLSSKRLQRVLKVLADCREHTTMEIIQCARVCAVNSIIAELRANGIAICCRRDRGVYYYRLGRPGKAGRP
ncbi:MAG: hypothetical protein KDH15_12125 [Rhodocyclaceae bacterium]|nr:hypothetical protein [Rhodocyclaceae bacterium]